MKSASKSPLLFFIAIFGLLIGGCSDQGAVADNGLRFAIQHDDREWHYNVYLPDNYDPENTYWPLIQLYGPLGLDRLASERGLDAIVIRTGGFKNNFSGCTGEKLYCSWIGTHFPSETFDFTVSLFGFRHIPSPNL